jgi:hypothetical protein
LATWNAQCSEKRDTASGPSAMAVPLTASQASVEQALATDEKASEAKPARTNMARDIFVFTERLSNSHKHRHYKYTSIGLTLATIHPFSGAFLMT